MKKIHILAVSFLIGIAAFLATSCENANVKNLKKAVRETNLACPIWMEWGMVNAVSYDEAKNQVIMNIDYDWIPYSFDEIPSDSIMKRNFILNQILEGGGNQVFKDISNADASLQMQLEFRIQGRNRSATIEFTPEEVKEMYRSEMSVMDARRELISLLVRTVSDSPEIRDAKWEDGMRMERVELDGDSVVYTISVDEKMYDMAIMRANRAALKDVMLQNAVVQGKDKNFEKVLDQIMKAGMCLVYRYDGTGRGGRVEIAITQADYDRARGIDRE